MQCLTNSETQKQFSETLGLLSPPHHHHEQLPQRLVQHGPALSKPIHPAGQPHRHGARLRQEVHGRDQPEDSSRELLLFCWSLPGCQVPASLVHRVLLHLVPLQQGKLHHRRLLAVFEESFAARHHWKLFPKSHLSSFWQVLQDLQQLFQLLKYHHQCTADIFLGLINTCGNRNDNGCISRI